MSSACRKQRMGGLPACFVPRITTFPRSVFRGCRYSLMFRPPSLLSPQIVPTAAILLQGSRGFYVRAYRALLPPHAPDMLTVRIQVIDGTGTFTLSDSQPCRLLTSLHRSYPASAVSGRRRRARLLLRWPPSAAQTGRAVFPHPAFMNGLLRPEAKVSVRPALPA